MKFVRLLFVNINRWNRPYRRYSSEYTIFSLCSGYGKCGVSVIRVSGPGVRCALDALNVGDLLHKPRYAHLRNIRSPVTGEILDKGIVLWFPGPNSFTGEDSCELQVHGSLAVVQAILDALAVVPGLRLAGPGEFTKRAFFNGKLDLTEVEGLADLIHAETEAQRKQALLQSNGALSRLYSKWRQSIMKCIAHLEAFIDFGEDENIEKDILDKIKVNLKNIKNNIEKHLNDHRKGELLRDGVKTVIVGPPNVGKSSLINFLCQRKVSIVTPIAGTTRDIVESTINIGGYPIILADTAGLRGTSEDFIELEGINLAIQRISASDLIILMSDATDLLNYLRDSSKADIKNYYKQYLESLGLDNSVIETKHLIHIVNKIDLLCDSDLRYFDKMVDIILISCKNEGNTSKLLETLSEELRNICGQPSAESPMITQSRYRHLLLDCVNNIESFLAYYENDSNPDLSIAAHKLRKAVRCIEHITGQITTDEILGIIFKDFCIGK